MKKKELDKFREILNEEKEKLLQHLEELSESSEEDLAPSASGDPVDIASLEISQKSLEKLGKRETFLLKKIELALKKIDDGTFGECESCGEEIAVARLLARPVAQLCIDCKTEQESHERKFSNREEEPEDDDGLGDEGDDI